MKSAQLLAESGCPVYGKAIDNKNWRVPFAVATLGERSTECSTDLSGLLLRVTGLISLVGVCQQIRLQPQYAYFL